MCAPHRFAWPGLARWWVPRAVAHIHCPGNIVAPRRSPCFKGCCSGYQYRRLSPSHRLGPLEVLLCVVFNSHFLRILLACVFIFRRLKLHGCADRYIPPCLLAFHLFIRIESWPIIIHYLVTRKIHGKQCDKQKYNGFLHELGLSLGLCHLCQTVGTKRILRTLRAFLRTLCVLDRRRHTRLRKRNRRQIR